MKFKVLSKDRYRLFAFLFERDVITASSLTMTQILKVIPFVPFTSF